MKFEYNIRTSLLDLEAQKALFSYGDVMLRNMSDSEEEANEKQLKIVLVGEQNVGKTNLIKKFCFDDFSRTYVPTIGADFYVKRQSFLGNKEVTVRLTDVSGLELNGHMLETYLFQVNIVILVYDITNHLSFDSLAKWLGKIKSFTLETTMFITAFGNKCDIEHKRAVRLDKTNHFIHDNQLNNYFVSAKTGENVNSSFIEIIAKYLNLPLSSQERDKQSSVLKVELIPNTPKNGRPKRRKNPNVPKLKSKDSCLMQ